MEVVAGKQTILSITQLLVLVVVVVQLLLVCQVEVMKEDVSLVVVRGNDDSFDSIHGK